MYLGLRPNVKPVLATHNFVLAIGCLKIVGPQNLCGNLRMDQNTASIDLHYSFPFWMLEVWNIRADLHDMGLLLCIYHVLTNEFILS